MSRSRIPGSSGSWDSRRAARSPHTRRSAWSSHQRASALEVASTCVFRVLKPTPSADRGRAWIVRTGGTRSGGPHELQRQKHSHRRRIGRSRHHRRTSLHVQRARQGTSGSASRAGARGRQGHPGGHHRQAGDRRPPPGAEGDHPDRSGPGCPDQHAGPRQPRRVPDDLSRTAGPERGLPAAADHGHLAADPRHRARDLGPRRHRLRPHRHPQGRRSRRRPARLQGRRQGRRRQLHTSAAARHPGADGSRSEEHRRPRAAEAHGHPVGQAAVRRAVPEGLARRAPEDPGAGLAGRARDGIDRPLRRPHPGQIAKAVASLKAFTKSLNAAAALGGGQ